MLKKEEEEQMEQMEQMKQTKQMTKDEQKAGECGVDLVCAHGPCSAECSP
jgi:hypothetical protein